MDTLAGKNAVQDLPALRDDPLDATLRRLRLMMAGGTGVGLRRLPPERELAGSFGVSRAAVRKAFDILEAENLVRRHVGRGTFVIGHGTAVAVKTPPGNELATGFALAAAGVSPRELIDARFVVEPAIAELAATAARPADVEELRRCLRKRETAVEPDTYEMWDYSLHMAIANATHNALLVQILEQIHHLRRSNDWRRYRRTTLAPARKRVSDPQHRAIVEAIARHDPRASAEAMRVHIQTIRRHMLEEPA
jgi:DNA-binding FadR family transcriptional regulator